MDLIDTLRRARIPQFTLPPFVEITPEEDAAHLALPPYAPGRPRIGIVSLPGMMTGQILSGTAPTIAVTYQIAIMMGILGPVSLTVILLLQFGYKTFFNDQDQLL